MDAIDEGFVPLPLDELPGLRWLEAVLLTAVFCMIGAVAGEHLILRLLHFPSLLRNKAKNILCAAA